MSDPGNFWDGEYDGAVSLTFDDGRQSQLEYAVPLLDERDLRGTFYASAGGDDYAEALHPWKQVADSGHEIGNHTLSHTCSRNFSDEIGADGLETMTLEQLEQDIVQNERRLQQIVPADERSFAYPCYQSHVGAGPTRKSYVPIIAKHFAAGRGVGEYAFANSPVNCDLYYLWSENAEHLRSTELIGMAHQAVNRGRWIIFTFHSVGPSRLGISEHDFCQLLDYLVQKRERIWTAPLVEIAEYCRDLQADAGRER